LATARQSANKLALTFLYTIHDNDIFTFYMPMENTLNILQIDYKLCSSVYSHTLSHNFIVCCREKPDKISRGQTWIFAICFNRYSLCMGNIIHILFNNPYWEYFFFVTFHFSFYFSNCSQKF